MTTKKCQWCGEEFSSKHPAKLYCSAACKNEMGNFMGVVGKRIAATAMKWRAARGGRENGGASAMKELCFLLDEANAELKSARPKGAPTIHDYYAARNIPNGIRTGRDR